MARKTFRVDDITQILTRWHEGRPKSQIASSLGMNRRTISKYVAPAMAAGLAPGEPPLSLADWSARVQQWFPELADARLRQVTWPAIAAHHEHIAAQLRADVPVATIHQRLCGERGLAVSVASFRRYVAANLTEESHRPQARARQPDPARSCGAGGRLTGARRLSQAGEGAAGRGLC